MNLRTIANPFIVGTVLAVSSPLSVAAAATPATRCTSSEDANVSVLETEATVRRKPRITVTQTNVRDFTANQQTFTSVIRKGLRTITEFHVSIPETGSAVVTRRFGQGFKGISEIQLRQVGTTLEMTVDGRRVSTAALQTDPPAVVFDDGQPSPTFRMKRELTRVFRKARKASLECPPTVAPTAAREFNDPFETECDTCHFGCFAKGYACEAATLGLSNLLSIFSSSLSCMGGVEDCTENCNSPGNECCRAYCGTNCCRKLRQDVKREDFVCAGASPTSPGQCCEVATGSVCGDQCCGVGTQFCADPNKILQNGDKGQCCPAGGSGCGETCCHPGSFCADPKRNQCCNNDSEGCGFSCCPVGSRCLSPGDDPELVLCNVCPPDKKGPACADTCCAVGEICDGDSCCRPEQTCGGSCCEPRYCLNGNNCCAPPSHICGGNCCAPFQSCCNGQCCNGPCVNGVCCTPERACGTTCCPNGWACTDKATSTCQPCGAGELGCAPVEGNPMCCPTGTDCCASGDCCAPPLTCCVRDGVPGCRLPEACVR